MKGLSLPTTAVRMKRIRSIQGDSMAEVGIFVGTMYGNSLLVAEEAEAILSGQGHKATVYEDPEVKDWEKYKINMCWW
jgi:hypothetical protein